MRLFLAINLDPAVRRAIAGATAALRGTAPGLNWADEARLHLTLKFLGEQDENIVEPLGKTLTDVASRHRPFMLRVREVGAFPNFRRARVVWLGVEREPRLELLHHDVEVACEGHGFELEGRPFRPHVTLARIPSGSRTSEDELRRLWRASKQVAFEDESEVRSIDIMRSTPGPHGSRYECLHAAPLRVSSSSI